MNGLAGIIPTFIVPGMMTPGVFGPITVAPLAAAISSSSSVSLTGTCSGMATSSLMPASRASLAAGRKWRAGTNTADTSAPVASTASATVSYIGMPSKSRPPLPGVTPAAMFVPYSTMSRVWCEPNLPVMPCTTTGLFAAGSPPPSNACTSATAAAGACSPPEPASPPPVTFGRPP